ncbi:MAG: hypothetical protein GEU78_06765 [Actinobacteria bacterium]|nr:hypothetical protein [Actinomycetota bacterium]
MLRIGRVAVAVSLLAVALVATTNGADAREQDVSIGEFTIDEDALCDVRDQWMDQMLASNEPGTWAKMKFTPSDAQLDRLGLPSSEILRAGDYSRPTLVTKDGRYIPVGYDELQDAFAQSLAAQKDGRNGNQRGGKQRGRKQTSDSAGPTVATYAGTGCLGIRPGALLLSVTSNSIGWCSMAHVYGSPGSYDISTAGHCGKTGTTATVIAGLGNRGDATGVILLDFGKFATSKDAGLGNDWALIDIYSQYQNLVTPTMCFWGGPRGTYTATGSLVGVSFPGNSLIPDISLDPNPFLAQTIVHYGHGAAVGTGGTPRVGEAIAWGSTHFMFFGAISPGDSGSGANTLTGDTVGANMEAAGIMTHLYIDPLMRKGLGIMGGTRATAVAGTLANGQIVPYPAPLPGLP